jgi:hypothetical protein
MNNKIMTVDIKKLTKIRDEIDNLLQNKNYRSIIPATENQNKDIHYDYDKKEEVLLKIVADNPGITKQKVIDKCTYSRVTTLKYIEKLKNHGFIIIKLDENNTQKHHLYINNEDELISLKMKLRDFEMKYFYLLEQNKIILRSLDKNKVFSSATFIELTGSIILPLKVLMLILFFSNFISERIIFNNDLMVRRFLIINEFIKETLSKLFEIFQIDSSTKKKHIIEDIYHITGIEESLRLSSIEENINIFKKYNLQNTAEDVWNSLWNIVHPFIPDLFDYYLIIYRSEKEGFSDLKKLISIKQKFTIY